MVRFLLAPVASLLVLNVLGVAGQTPSSCNSQTTPNCIQSLYDLPQTRATQLNNGVGVFSSGDEFANRADLAIFLRDRRPDLTPAPSFSEVFIDGGRNDQDSPSADANLGIQYTVGLTNGVPVTFYSVGRNDTTGMFDFANYLLAQPNPPSVIVFPYAFNEASINPQTATQICDLFMQLGARGVSVIVASGDGGVAGVEPDNNCATFRSTFPASCPYVTVVGGTTGVQETGASFSAGGFSIIFSRPQYQSNAVSAYLNVLGSQYSGKYTSSGRAYPDVSAQSERLLIVHKGQYIEVEGTAGAAVIFASTIALLNDQLIASGKPTAGFLNPFLYSSGAQALNDITTGSNPSCGTNGFPAAKGWDPVTGLGTPNFLKLKSALGL